MQPPGCRWVGGSLPWRGREDLCSPAHRLPGRRDSSGIRLYYTATLRRFDAGIMELGLVYTPVMAIPPQEVAFVLTGYCTDKCTQMVSGTAWHRPGSPAEALQVAAKRGQLSGLDSSTLNPSAASPGPLYPLCTAGPFTLATPLPQ